MKKQSLNLISFAVIILPVVSFARSSKKIGIWKMNFDSFWEKKCG